MFRRLVPMVASITLAFAAYAKPISSADLKKVNDYIAAEMEKEEKGLFTIEITKGEVEDVKTPNGIQELITGLGVVFTAKKEDGSEEGKGYVNLGLKQEATESLVDTEAGLSWIMENPKEFFEEYSQFAFDIIDSVNAKGFYKAQLNVTSIDGGGYEAILTLEPASPDAKSIKSLVLKGVFPNQADSYVDVDFAALFALTSDLVGNAQISLTKVFKALQNETEPTDDDMEGLEALFEALFAELGFAE